MIISAFRQNIVNDSPNPLIRCQCPEAGLLPRQPTVVVGRQYLLDAARVPPGAAALWLQLQEVPYASHGDAAGELDTTGGIRGVSRMES
jgi:phytoene dehydrogenase-like protein